ncbi:MAG: enoyl-CoA hydratase-related protein [Bryobacterales bacterium]|nr:enoyl-CoA hydratase-related protein [Bryobacterales bacterium]
MSTAHVRLERDACVATVRLARPGVRNALDDETVGQLHRTLDAAGRDPRVRIVKLAGEGSCFCAGVDLRSMHQMGRASAAENLASSLRFSRMLAALHAFPKPTVAVVQGAAVGGGVGLVACCDFSVASTSAFFRLSEVRLGLVPAMVSPYLVEALGARAARRIMLSAERVDAERAREIGLVDEVVPPAELQARAREVVDRLLLGAPGALAACKRLVREVAESPLDAAIHERTAKLLATRRASEEGQEGVRAFLNKRRPAWTMAECGGSEECQD